MREKLDNRLEQLDTEYHTGTEMLAQLDAKRTELQQTLLRISGAIEVLKELLADDSDTPPPEAALAAQP
jgi:hypothetical protein